MTTVWILGDQLSHEHAALANADPRKTVVLMVESKARGSVLKYHQQKLVMIYSAMRHFAAELEDKGWAVDYVRLDEGLTFEEAAKRHLKAYSPDRILLAEPNSRFEADALEKLGRRLNVSIEFVPTTQFLCSRDDFRKWAGGSGKRLLMESHYRRMRKELGILMRRDGEPEGGRWNFDEDNRRTFSEWKASGEKPPELPRVRPDERTSEVIEMVEREFADHPGAAGNFRLPVTRRSALHWLRDFVEKRLPQFGDFEDMMATGEPTLFHSLLSPTLNIGLLTPLECVDAAVDAWRAKKAPLNAVEGFVRQIIGWREYVNGVYWLRGPDYRESNELGADRPLPDWFYTGDIPMNCLRHVLQQVIDTGWNHHIQRLMVLGNFFLLAGIRPQEVLRWFSEMYVDAFEWVMVPNVIGMCCHADGGTMMTKPYAAGGAYIDRMSDYCSGCRFSPKKKTGPDACPFNYLYWHFYDQHLKRFENNPRVMMPVKSWLRRKKMDKEAVRESAERFLDEFVVENGR